MKLLRNFSVISFLLINAYLRFVSRIIPSSRERARVSPEFFTVDALDFWERTSDITIK